MVNTMPRTRSNKFLVHTHDAGREHIVAKKLGIEQLMSLYGERAADYTDLTQIAKYNAFSKMGKSLSKFKAPFMDMILGQGGVREIDTNWVQWRVYGQPDHRCMMHGDANLPEEECAYLGLNGSTFKVWVDHDVYSALDVLAPVNNKNFQMVVQSDYATPFKGGFTYDVVLLDNDPEAHFERYLFEAGEYLLKMGSLQSWEEIGSFGSIQMGETFSYLEYRVPLTTGAWTFEIEGEAHRRSKNITIVGCDDIGVGPNGEQVPMGINSAGVTNYFETKAKMQIEAEKELMLMYGRYSEGMLDPKTLKEITTSPGIMEWFEYGNEVRYNPKVNSLDFISEIMEGLWEDRIPTDGWDLELMTGKGGLKLFSQWVAEKFGDLATVMNYDFVLQKRTAFDNNYGRDGYAYVPPQFVEYVLPGYGRIRVAHWPVLDDQKINGVKFPGSNLPVSSYEFIALDSGFGEPNIQKLVRRDNDYTGYNVGWWSPYGAVNEKNPVYKNPDINIGDRYRFYHRESFGILVMDPELLIRFRPNIQY